MALELTGQEVWEAAERDSRLAMELSGSDTIRNMTRLYVEKAPEFLKNSLESFLSLTQISYIINDYWIYCGFNSFFHQRTPCHNYFSQYSAYSLF